MKVNNPVSECTEINVLLRMEVFNIVNMDTICSLYHSGKKVM